MSVIGTTILSRQIGNGNPNEYPVKTSIVTGTDIDNIYLGTTHTDLTSGIGFGAQIASHQVLIAGIYSTMSSNVIGSEAGYLSFMTKPTSDYVTERLRITSDGNVNIQGNLSVSGNDTVVGKTHKVMQSWTNTKSPDTIFYNNLTSSVIYVDFVIGGTPFIWLIGGNDGDYFEVSNIGDHSFYFRWNASGGNRGKTLYPIEDNTSVSTIIFRHVGGYWNLIGTFPDYAG